uniref:Uncharacterized protein n=1 Tax=Rhizophora mucronata TaxID=61149 RepID=A0A2P2NPA5_RHIMU
MEIDFILFKSQFGGFFLHLQSCYTGIFFLFLLEGGDDIRKLFISQLILLKVCFKTPCSMECVLHPQFSHFVKHL